MDLISRQAAIDELWREPECIDPLNVMAEARDRIANLPSAQERKRGRWVKENIVLTSNPPQYRWHCSECGRLNVWFSTEKNTNYCPNCGAKMDADDQI